MVNNQNRESNIPENTFSWESVYFLKSLWCALGSKKEI